MSPFEHGEVFVLDDGGEADLDLGNYERFLGVRLSRDHNITTGKVSYFILFYLFIFYRRFSRCGYCFRFVACVVHKVVGSVWLAIDPIMSVVGGTTVCIYPIVTICVADGRLWLPSCVCYLSHVSGCTGVAVERKRKIPGRQSLKLVERRRLTNAVSV